MGRLSLIFLFVALAGCFTAGKRGAEQSMTIYDLGSAGAPTEVVERAFPLVVEVRSPLWMDSMGINYRLAYADPLNLREYAQARWAGPPAQMVQERLTWQPGWTSFGQGVARCLLHIDINEFSQHFETAERSIGNLQGKAFWLDRSRRQLAERVLDIRRPATTPDSRGGVGALQSAVEQLLRELHAWESELAATGALAACSA